jgi:hypothetical protein
MRSGVWTFGVMTTSLSLYFGDTNRWATMYGFKGAFKIIQNGWIGPHLVTVMEKVAEPGVAPKR